MSKSKIVSISPHYFSNILFLLTSETFEDHLGHRGRSNWYLFYLILKSRFRAINEHFGRVSKTSGRLSGSSIRSLGYPVQIFFVCKIGREKEKLLNRLDIEDTFGSLGFKKTGFQKGDVCQKSVVLTATSSED